MTNVTRKTTNKFTKGLVMDFSPENTKNEVLTNALNATLLTFNGNELSLLNDMGNVRVESAFLPEGFIPVGTCEYGGIIYIVSYNPLEDKSLIGCFPSPERNVSRDELGEPAIQLTKDYFQGEDGEIKHNTQCVLLKSNNLNPGDKFVITANESIYGEALSDLYTKDADTNTYTVKENPILALNVVSIEDSGKIVYLNSSIRQYENGDNKYHILGTNNTLGKSIEDYRNVLSSGYNVFKSKTSGKLAILAELIMIDSYSVTHSIKPTDAANTFNIIIHTEVSPTITENNKNTAPKLKYYYLKNSKGYLQKPDETINILSDGDDIQLSALYEDLTSEGNLFKNSNGDPITLGKDNFKFPLENTYHEIGNSTTYNDVTLASVTIPDVIANNGLDLPFKYDYTLVPCMNYGKLDHLAVSNTISFDKLHDFERSDFNVWKYKIDDNLLRLTFGTEVFDTYEEHKVDGLILEFYDCWGFAGSVEITDKKSYSGVFTKILSLNTVNAISKKRVIDDEYKETQFARNINITTKDNGYVYNGKSVKHNEEKGWCYNNDTPLEVSDCGTLYSNIIYGVKTYLKRTTVDTEEYIPKRDFFLYTLPILNDYYYSIEDFSSIKELELDFVLTYKLVNNDNNIRTEYSGEGFVNGYNTNDNKIIGDYLSGNYTSNAPIDVTKYYNYTGTSDLYLEIGLKKDYEALNIAYDPDINTKFSCTLKLLNDEGESSVLVEKDLLNYGNYEFDNILEFEDNDDTLKKTNREITTDGENIGIKKHNFLNFKGEPIKINYNFIVGYKANISNIRDTQVPVTTVCALCHKREDGTYNYEDFNILVKQINDLGDCLYLSNAMFYNSGNNEELKFGLCRQVDITGNVETQCLEYITKTSESSDIKTPGKLNTGLQLNELCDHIGKLSFCQPHIHGISEDCYLNIDNNNQLVLTDSHNFAYNLFSTPYYTMTANTQETIEQNSLYITVFNHRYKLKEGSFTGEQLSKFNKAMIETMKSVYAYNPDYDQLKVKLGEVTLQNYSPSFTSNVISSNAKLELDNINDYIYLGPIKLSLYIQKLLEHSGIITYYNLEDDLEDDLNKIQFLNNLTFKPNLLYCGEDNYLITSLTYNTPVPKELEEELEFTSFENTIIKHSNGKNTQIKGIPNNKTLYGFKNNSLLNLDVSVYEIDDEGILSIKDTIQHTSYKNLSTDNKNTLFRGGVNISFDFNDSFPEPIILKLLKPTFSTKQSSFEPNFLYFYNLENDCLYVSFKYTNTSEESIIFNLSIENTVYTYTITPFVGLSKYDVVTFTCNNPDPEEMGSSLSNNTDNIDKYFDSNYKPHNTTISKVTDPGSTLDKTVTKEFKFNLTIQEGQNNLHYRTIFKIQNPFISYLIVRTVDIPWSNQPFIDIPKTYTWSWTNKPSSVYYDTQLYEVLNNNSLLYCSTITLNDLQYIPNLDGHRLFIKPYNYNRSASKVIYRSSGSFNLENHSKNTLVLFSGPGYKPINE